MTADNLHIKIARAVLCAALDDLGKLVAWRSSLPILRTVLIRARAGGGVTLTTSDMESEAQCAAPAEILAPGAVAVTAHLLADIARKTAGAVLELRHSDRCLHLRGEGARFELFTFPPEDFPVFPTDDVVHNFTLGAEQVRALLLPGLGCASTEEVRYNLCSVWLHRVDGRLIAAMTDGHKLAEITTTAPPDLPEDFPGLLLARKTAQLLCALAESNTGDVGIAYAARRVGFTFGSTTLRAKLIDARFPDYRRVVPQNNPHQVRIEAAALAAGVQRAMCISSTVVALALAPDEITITAKKADDSVAEALDAHYAGPKLTLGVNPKYLLALLEQLKKLVLSVGDDGAPLLLTDDDLSDRRYVLMPVRLQSGL